MIETARTAALDSVGVAATKSPIPRTGAGAAFAAALQATVDAVQQADGLAGAIASGHGDVLAASIARAKADAMLEITAVSAARVGAAINTLLQTQV